MSAEYKPCLEIPNKRRKPFDPSLCIVCQKLVERHKRGKPPIIDDDSFKVFIDVFKILEEKGDVLYHQNREAIKNKSHTDLKNENFCFHPTPCRRDFQRILSNSQRKGADGDAKEKKKEKAPLLSPRISRQQTTTFDRQLCLFCQGRLPGESLYNLCQTSRDGILKVAFAECPESLALYKIRCSHAFDGMAGDIKYHQSCWRDHIDKRVPEHEVRTAQRMSSKFLITGTNETDEFVPDDFVPNMEEYNEEGHEDEQVSSISITSDGTIDMDLRGRRRSISKKKLPPNFFYQGDGYIPDCCRM